MLVLKHLGRCRHETCYRTIESVLISINQKISRTTANEIRSSLAKRENNYIICFFGWSHLLSKCVWKSEKTMNICSTYYRTKFCYKDGQCQSTGSKKQSQTNIRKCERKHYAVELMKPAFVPLPTKMTLKDCIHIYVYIYINIYINIINSLCIYNHIIYIYIPFPDLLFRSGNP